MAKIVILKREIEQYKKEVLSKLDKIKTQYYLTPQYEFIYLKVIERLKYIEDNCNIISKHQVYKMLYNPIEKFEISLFSFKGINYSPEKYEQNYLAEVKANITNKLNYKFGIIQSRQILEHPLLYSSPLWDRIYAEEYSKLLSEYEKKDLEASKDNELVGEEANTRIHIRCMKDSSLYREKTFTTGPLFESEVEKYIIHIKNT